MTPSIRRGDLLLVGAVAAVVFALAAAGGGLAGRLALALALAILVATVMALQIEAYRRTKQLLDRSGEDYRQIEALFSLYSSLDVSRPLPPMREFAVSPDFANLIVATILERKPRHVLELGSGVSTLVTAYALRQAGRGRVVSLEHEGEYAERTSALVRSHGLEDTARVVHAPLRAREIEGRTWSWYDTVALGAEPVDLLIVDGPPTTVQRLARYPALPLLGDALSPSAVVLVDDADRPDERRMIELWLERRPDFRCATSPCEKGAAVLRREPAETGRG